MGMPVLPREWSDWTLLEKIGQGSYGSVYKASRRDRGEEVIAAIKIIQVPPDQSDGESLIRELSSQDTAKAYFLDMVNDYMREVKTMIALSDSKNIVTIQAYHVEEQKSGIGWTLYIRMDYLQSLTDYQIEHFMTEEDVLRLGKDICKALICCEKARIIHRDIKPDNIFVDETGEFKLGDFGVARNMERTQGTMSVKGSFSYMAPEVYMGHRYDARADIYSLGLVMYRIMNNGREPFMDASKGLVQYRDKKAALQKRLDGAPLPEPANASDQVSRVIKKACSYRPAARYGSAAEFLTAIERLGTRETRKKRKRILAGAAAGVLLIASIIGTAAYRASRPKQLDQYLGAQVVGQLGEDFLEFETKGGLRGVARANHEVVIEPGTYQSFSYGIKNQFIFEISQNKYGILSDEQSRVLEPEYDGIWVIPMEEDLELYKETIRDARSDDGDAKEINRDARSDDGDAKEINRDARSEDGDAKEINRDTRGEDGDASELTYQYKVKMEDKIGAVSREGKVLLEPEYEDVKWVDPYFIMKKDGGYYLARLDGEVRELDDFFRRVVKNDGMYRLYREDGSELDLSWGEEEVASDEE